jgi:hypothetical protein
MESQHLNPDGTTNGVEVLSDATGIPRLTIVELWTQVRENARIMAACPTHDFEPPSSDLRKHQRKCRNCGGSTDRVNANWYELGLLHARNQ